MKVEMRLARKTTYSRRSMSICSAAIDRYGSLTPKQPGCKDAYFSDYGVILTTRIGDTELRSIMYLCVNHAVEMYPDLRWERRFERLDRVAAAYYIMKYCNFPDCYTESGSDRCTNHTSAEACEADPGPLNCHTLIPAPHCPHKSFVESALAEMSELRSKARVRLQDEAQG